MADVRPIDEQEAVEYLRCLRTAFLVPPDPTDEQVGWFLRRVHLDRTVAVFVDGRLVGGSRTFPTRLTVPGGTVAASALTQVNVAPTHRRRGLLVPMMRAHLDAAARRGEPVVILIASEWPIYGRFGFGPATEQAEYRIDRLLARFRDPACGSTQLVGPAELRRIAPAVYDQVRAHHVGALGRDGLWWDDLTGVDPRPGAPAPPARTRAIWRDEAGAPCGYVVYDPTEGWEEGRPAAELTVRELVAATPDAYRELWRFLCQVDLVHRIRAAHRPVDEHLPLLLADGRVVRQEVRSDHLWVRIVDPVAALSARRYASAGRLTLEIGDRFGGAATTVALEGSPDAAACGASGDAADLRVDVAALGAAYLGGTSFAALAAAGQVVELRPGALALADAMFGARPAPHLTTNF